MSRKICNLSIWAGLLAAVVWPSAGAGIVAVGNGSSFSYACSAPEVSAKATVVRNLYANGDPSYVAPNGWFSGGCAYVMWHFQTSGTGTTFGNDLKLSGRVTNFGWGDATVYILTSTQGDVAALDNLSLSGWDTYWSRQWGFGSQSFDLASLNGAGAGGSDFYVAFYVKYPSWADYNNYMAEFFRSCADEGNFPFILTGSLNTAAVPEAVNLLSEPDFEEAAAGNWVWSKNLTPTATWAITGAQKYSGAQSVKFTYGSAYKTSRWARFTQTVPVHANSAYEFSAYVKGTGVTASGAALAAGSNAATKVYFPSGTFGWTPYSLTIDTGANTSLPFLFHLERPVTELDVDNAKLTEIFLVNSGFENAVLVPWYYSVVGNPVNSGSVVSGVAGSDGKCFRLTYGSPANGDEAAFVVQTVTNLRPNTRYVCELRYKGTGIGDWAAVVTGRNWDVFKFLPQGEVPDWTKLVFAFDTDAAGGGWPVAVMLKSPTTSLYVDNIKFYRACDYLSHDAGADAGNLLKYPSFETAASLGDSSKWWLAQGANGGNATATIVTSENHKGGKSLRLAGNTATWGDNKYSVLLQQVGNLSPNTAYRLTAFVKGADVREACLMADWSQRAYLPLGSYDWTLVTLDFTTGPSQTSLTVGLLALNQMTSIGIDNCRLRPLTKTAAVAFAGSDVTSAHAIHPCDDASGNAFPLLASQGFRRARYDMRWDETEVQKTTPATYDWTRCDAFAANADAAGVKLWLVLNYGNALYDHDSSGQAVGPCTDAGRQAFADWAQAAMRRYRGRGYVFELYNEPNGAFWAPKPNVANYIALASKVGTTVRADSLISTECLVLPALAALFDVNLDYNFAIPLLQSGVTAYFDGFSVHPYRTGKPESIGADYRFLQQMIHNFNQDRSIPVITGEVGYDAGSLGEQVQANYYGRLFMQSLLAKSPSNNWYNSFDTWWSGGQFGLMREDHTPRPSWAVAGQIVPHLGGRTLCWRLANAGALDPDAHIIKFTGDAYVVWSGNGSKTVTIPAFAIAGGTYAYFDQAGTHLADIATTVAGLTVPADEGIHYLHLLP